MEIAGQLVLGGAVGMANIAIHAVATTWVIQVARKIGEWSVTRSSAYLIRVMSLSVLVLMLAHFVEVGVWAMVYWLVGVLPATPGATNVYFAFVNYTTLGYGDIVPVDRWSLLGPATAMNGVLLFGWSTAVMFEILRRSIARSTLTDTAS
jgi:hypothetical protein